MSVRGRAYDASAPSAWRARITPAAIAISLWGAAAIAAPVYMVREKSPAHWLMAAMAGFAVAMFPALIVTAARIEPSRPLRILSGAMFYAGLAAALWVAIRAYAPAVLAR